MAVHSESEVMLTRCTVLVRENSVSDEVRNEKMGKKGQLHRYRAPVYLLQQKSKLDWKSELLNKKKGI